MSTRKPPTAEEMRDAVRAAKMAQPYPPYSLPPEGAGIAEAFDATAHEIPERMQSGGLSDAPDDGGPVAVRGGLPATNLRSGR